MQTSQPLFTIFTPTHNPKYLPELYQSLLAQTDDNWQWVILYNTQDENTPYPSPLEIAQQDSRVIQVQAPVEIAKKGIGALKQLACSYGDGDYLVEVDHDDLLTSNAIAEFKQAALLHNPDVIFSDFVNFHPDHSCDIFGEAYGWESYPVDYNGHTYTAMRAFEANPSSLHRIWYAPNHVRIFKRSFYHTVGGHNESLHVCDDHELLCRMYAQGGKFHHIPKMLYLYRLLPASNNSYLKWNQDIQIIQEKIGDKYLIPMVERWAQEHELPMLDMGGAHNSPENYVSIDMQGSPDLLCDITKGLPFADNSIGVIRCVDFLEHIPNMQIIPMMNEFYRVLAPNGWLITATPAFPSKGAIQDPTHVSFWSTNNFWYFTNREYAKYIPSFTGRFQAAMLQEFYPDEFCQQNDIKYVHANLTALKGQKQCGEILI